MKRKRQKQRETKTETKRERERQRNKEIKKQRKTITGGQEVIYALSFGTIHFHLG